MIYEINAIIKKDLEANSIEFLGECSTRRTAFKTADQNKKKKEYTYIEVKLFNNAGDTIKVWHFSKNNPSIEIL